MTRDRGEQPNFDIQQLLSSAGLDNVYYNISESNNKLTDLYGIKANLEAQKHQAEVEAGAPFDSQIESNRSEIVRLAHELAGRNITDSVISSLGHLSQVALQILIGQELNYQAKFGETIRRLHKGPEPNPYDSRVCIGTLETLAGYSRLQNALSESPYNLPIGIFEIGWELVNKHSPGNFAEDNGQHDDEVGHAGPFEKVFKASLGLTGQSQLILRSDVDNKERNLRQSSKVSSIDLIISSLVEIDYIRNEETGYNNPFIVREGASKSYPIIERRSTMPDIHDNANHPPIDWAKSNAGNLSVNLLESGSKAKVIAWGDNLSSVIGKITDNQNFNSDFVSHLEVASSRLFTGQH